MRAHGSRDDRALRRGTVCIAFSFIAAFANLETRRRSLARLRAETNGRMSCRRRVQCHRAFGATMRGPQYCRRSSASEANWGIFIKHLLVWLCKHSGSYFLIFILARANCICRVRVRLGNRAVRSACQPSEATRIRPIGMPLETKNGNKSRSAKPVEPEPVISRIGMRLRRGGRALKGGG